MPAIEGEFVVIDDAGRPFDRIDVRIDAASIDTKVEARDEDLCSERFFSGLEFLPVRRHVFRANVVHLAVDHQAVGEAAIPPFEDVPLELRDV